MVSVVAHSWSICRLTQGRIRPGDEITPFLGSWALTKAVIQQERAYREARVFRDQLDFFIARLPA